MQASIATPFYFLLNDQNVVPQFTINLVNLVFGSFQIVPFQPLHCNCKTIATGDINLSTSMLTAKSTILKLCSLDFSFAVSHK